MSTRPRIERAEIIAVGTELTTGSKLDSNSQWFSVELANAGIPVWPPMFAWSVFSFDPNASKRSRAICLSLPRSSH